MVCLGSGEEENHFKFSEGLFYRAWSELFTALNKARAHFIILNPKAGTSRPADSAPSLPQPQFRLQIVGEQQALRAILMKIVENGKFALRDLRLLRILVPDLNS
jgi:hypothetical protein